MSGFSLRKFVLFALALSVAAEGASSFSSAKMGATDAALRASHVPLAKRTGQGNDWNAGDGNNRHSSSGGWNSGKGSNQDDHTGKGEERQQKGGEQKKGSDDNRFGEDDDHGGFDKGGDVKHPGDEGRGKPPTQSHKGNPHGGHDFTVTPPTDPQLPRPSGQPRQKRSARKSLSEFDGNPMLIAKSVCPDNLFGCPIAEPGSLTRLPANTSAWFADGFECFDLENDLRACGGCASVNKVHDCTTILGADSVTCEEGRCVVQSCKKGFALDEDTDTCVSSN